MARLTKQKREQFVAQRFCEIYRTIANVPCDVLELDDAPDALLSIDGKEVFLELAGYREQGPHNASYDADTKIKNLIIQRWEDNPELQLFTPRPQYRDGASAFQLPRQSQELDNFVSELEAFILSLDKTRLEEFTLFAFKPLAELQQYRHADRRTSYVACEDYPTLSRFCDKLTIQYHPEIRTSMPSSSLNTRWTGLDEEELVAVVASKLQKLPKYRERAGGRPIWLLLYSEVWPPTARLPHDGLVPRAIEIIRAAANGGADAFEAIWWGQEIGVDSGSLHAVTRAA